MKIAASSPHHPLHAHRRRLNIPFGADRFLAVLEGLEGGFAIGASIVVALSFADLPRHVLIMTALVSIIVNGFNSAAVKYGSEHYLDELDGREKRSPLRAYFVPALIEFCAYFAISFISIIPLLVINELHLAVLVSTSITVILLFVAGWWRGFMLHSRRIRDACETSLLGLAIIGVGLLSGMLLH